MTKVINLFGGPGSGKSTCQADLYSYMKKQGLKVEMVREVAKKWAWKNDKISPLDQLNIIGQQIQDESALYGHVDYIITDSPILLGAFYMQNNFGQTFMTNMVHDYIEFARFNNIEFSNFLMNREGLKYNPSGRYETESQVEALDNNLKLFLHKNNITYDRIDYGHRMSYILTLINK